MTKRAKVLRDPYFGPGLLMVEGRQYPFLMDGRWRSQAPAKPGLLVDVELDNSGAITAITPVSELQLAWERSQPAQTPSRGTLFAPGRSKTWEIAPALAVIALVVSWYFLPFISIRSSLLGGVHLTFWQLLTHLNSKPQLPGVTGGDAPSTGFYGLAAFMAAAGPLLPFCIRDKRASLASLLPAILMIAMAVALVREDAHGFVADVYTATRATESLRSLTLDLGAYVSLSIAIYLAATTTRKFLRPRIRSETSLAGPERAAA